MKKLVKIAMGILFLGVVAFTFNGYALGAPGHGHGGHGHGGHGGHGHHGRGPRHHGFHRLPLYVGAGAAWVDDDCYLVRRCYTNAFGIVRCRRVRVCE